MGLSDGGTMNLSPLKLCHGGKLPWHIDKTSMFVPVRFANCIHADQLLENIEPSTDFWQLPTNDCVDSWLAFSLAKKEPAALSSWNGSPASIATPLPRGKGNF